MYAILLLTVVASATATVLVNSGCPEVKPTENFDLKAYAVGKWYEVAMYPNGHEVDSNCGWAEYVLKGDVFSVKNYGVYNGKLRSIEGSAKLAPDAGKTGKVTMTLPYGAGGALADNIMWNLGTDYENYSVLYYCKENDNNSRQDFAWIFSRTKKLEGDAKIAVDNIIKANPFLDPSKYIWPDFSDEACKYE